MNNTNFVSSGRKLFLLFILLLFLLACGIPGGKTTSTSTSEFPKNILVSLTDPLDGEAYPISAGLSIRGEAISDGSVTHMELWADGGLYEDYAAPEDGLGLLVHYWTWSPTTLGTHQLMVRAYNDQGQSTFSNVIRIKGIEDPGYVLITKAEDGDTIEGIAARYNTSVERILADNPNLTDPSSLLDGDEVFVHISAIQSASAPTAKAKLLMQISEWTMNREQNFLRQTGAPAAPALTVTGQGCNALLNISDQSNTEKGFQVYRLSPGAMSFSKLASLPANDGSSLSYSDSNLFGLYHYYITAFDANGEGASNLVGINITDTNCAGEPITIDDLASIPAGVEQYYLYVTVNNGDWRRFPAADFTYLKKSDNMDLGQVASALVPNLIGNISMRGEVWGLVNGTATLLGTVDKSFKPGQAPAMFDPSVIYQSLMTKLEVRGMYSVSTKDYDWVKESGFAYDTKTFRFGTDLIAANGVWQVSSVPFSSSTSFNPTCLLLTGKTMGVGTTMKPFEFNIDFSSLKPTVETVHFSPFEDSLSQTQAFSAPIIPGNLNNGGQQIVKAPKWNSGIFGLGSTKAISFDPCAQNITPEGVATYYVRVLPVINGQPAGNPSNPVILHYYPNSDIKIEFKTIPYPHDIGYEVKILNFTGLNYPDQKYEFCVVVVKNDNSMYGYKPGDVLCPKTFTGGNDSLWDEVSGAIEDAVNFISDAYNKLSDWVTELVEKLNPLCIQAKLASSAMKVGEEEVKDACHFIAVAVVTAAKTYVGLPPSLPNFDQLVDMGKDNLVELAAQELEANGVPCPQECKDVIRKGIDYSIEQVQNSMSNSSCMSEEEAHAHGDEPLCLPPGIITKPDPRGQATPAVLEVQVTRKPGKTGPDIPEPTSCNVTISSFAKNDSQIGKLYGSESGFEWQGTYIEGYLFAGTSSFPNLQPGQSVSMPIVLKPLPFWLPGHELYAHQSWKPDYFDDWAILHTGAMATINSGGICKFEFPEGVRFSTEVVTGESIQVGPLGKAWRQYCSHYGCP